MGEEQRKNGEISNLPDGDNDDVKHTDVKGGIRLWMTNGKNNRYEVEIDGQYING